MNTLKTYHSKWLIGGICSIIIALVLLICSFTIFRDTTYTDTNLPLSGSSYLSFSSNYAAVDTPLTVSFNGASDSEVTSYSWTIGDTVINNNTDTYTPVYEDLEKFITVTVTYDQTETVSASLYCSKLPVIYINTDEAVGDEYVGGTMAMQGNEEYNYANTDFYFGDVYLKLRGNSTRYRPKAPYKIKLGETGDLFNMGTSKHWLLLANDIDHTFIRNKLVYDFSNALGASFAAESINVVLILNNSYSGVYQLCEQIRVDEERVDIFSWEDLASDAAKMITNVKTETGQLSKNNASDFRERLKVGLSTDLSWITSPYIYTFEGTDYLITDYVDIPDSDGGFILEMDFYSLANEDGLTTNFKQPFYFNSPEFGFTNATLKTYAYKYIQSFEYALHSDDFFFDNNDDHYAGNGRYYDPLRGWVSINNRVFYNDTENDGKHYTQFFDMDSLLNNFFVCEFSMNWDSMKNSVFITKDVGKLAELNPVWDFDWAFGNNNMFNIDTYYPASWHTTNNYFTNEQYYQSVQWNRYLIKDPYFLMLAYEKYQEIRPTIIEDIIKDGGLLDQYYEDLYEAGVANDGKWSSTYGPYNGEYYTDSMNSLKHFITTRIKWMDEQFDSFDSFIKSLGYYNPDDRLEITDIKYNDDDTVTVAAYTSLENAKDLSLQINGTYVYTTYAGTDGIGYLTFDKSILGREGTNIIQLRAIDYNGNTIGNYSGTEPEYFSNHKIF